MSILIGGSPRLRASPLSWFSAAARREVLASLLNLHVRYAEEVKQGLHEKKQPRKTQKTREKNEEAGGQFE